MKELEAASNEQFEAKLAADKEKAIQKMKNQCAQAEKLNTAT